MIVARFPGSAARRAVRCTLRVAAIGIAVALTACKDGDAPAAAAGAQPARQRGDSTPVLEVVIARPAARYQPDPGVTGGAVTGTVAAPASIVAGSPIATGRDSAVCGPAMPDESVVREGNGLGGAVVWLDDIRRGRPLPLERRIELESDKCRLTPRVQGAVVGSAVNVIGHDDFRQHLRFLAGGESEPRASILLGKDEQVIPTEGPFSAPGLVVVKDTDHPWPTAYIAVFDHPYFAVTAPNGTFTIDGVPPGKYTVRAWHERTARGEQVVEVTAGGSARVDLTLTGK